MRISILAMGMLIGVALSVPAIAQQKPHRRECIKLTQQIARYERDAVWADERGNELWLDANLQQIARLAQRRERLCPEYRTPDYFAEFAELLGKAAKLALRWYLLGF